MPIFLPLLALVVAQVGGQTGAGSGDAARVCLRESAGAIRAAGSFVYDGERRPGGAFEGQLAGVSGQVRIKRVADDGPVGAWLWARGEVHVPRPPRDVAFLNSYDGRTFRSVRAADRVVVEDTPERGGRSLLSDGGDGVLLEPLLEAEPFKTELGSDEIKDAGSSNVDSVECRVIEVKMPVASSYHHARWHIATGDHLPRRVEMLYTIAGANGSQVTSASTLRAGPALGQGDFTVATPEGFTVKPLEQANGLLAPGTPAPDFELSDPSGATHKLSALRGHVVVLDFWATWCGPCKAAMPAIQRLHEKYGERGVVVLGIDINDRGDPGGYMKKQKYTYTLLLAGDDVARAYGVSPIPALFVIGTDGKILARREGGGEAAEQVLAEAIETGLTAVSK